MRMLTVLVLAGCLGCGSAGAGDDGAQGEMHAGIDGVLSFALEAVDAVTQGENTFRLELRQADAPLPGADVAVEVLMPAMGHGSSQTPVVHDVGGGRYRIDNVVFTMSGTWELRIRAAAGDAADRATFTSEVP